MAAVKPDAGCSNVQIMAVNKELTPARQDGDQRKQHVMERNYFLKALTPPSITPLEFPEGV